MIEPIILCYACTVHNRETEATARTTGGPVCDRCYKELRIGELKWTAAYEKSVNGYSRWNEQIKKMEHELEQMPERVPLNIIK